MPAAAIAAMSVMTVGGVWLAARRLTGRPWLTGVFFGVLAVIANTASVLSVAEYDIALSLRDAPVIAAALFFGPVPGIVAGAIAALERALTPLFGVGAPTWCPFATFLVALIAAAVRKWFFDGARPSPVQSLMLGTVFEMLHLSFDILLGLDRLERGCEIVFSAFVPESAGLALALVGSSAALGVSGGWREIFVSRASRLLEAYLGACAVAISCILLCSEYDSMQLVAGSVRRLDHLFESQVECLLHTDAAWLSSKLEDPERRSEENILKILSEDDFDELNLVGTDGRVKVSSRPETVGFDFHEHEETRKYLGLLDGATDFVSEPFRRCAGESDGPDVKYAGVPLPDGEGFLQMGFYRSRFENSFRTYFFPLFNGVMNFFSRDYTVIASTNDWKVAMANGGHRDAVGTTVQRLGIRPGHEHARLFGEWCHIGEKQVGEWRIFCVVPLVESYGEGMVISSVLSLILFVMIFGFRLVILRLRRQQKKIDALRDEVDRKRRQELETGAKIQQSCLPTEFPSDPGFRFSAKMCSAKEVGGDFYDCYRFRDGRIVITVADVSGKGVPGAMFMIMSKSTLKSSMFRHADPAAAVAEANDRLERHNDAQMFVTVWTGVYDPATGVVEYVNAGHNPPLVRRADGSVEWLRSRGGMALGVFAEGAYRVDRVVLGRGDSLLLYTDGVTEAQDVAGGFYGEPRLELLLGRASGDLVSAVFDDVRAFAGAAEQADDITAFALEVKP